MGCSQGIGCFLGIFLNGKLTDFSGMWGSPSGVITGDTLDNMADFYGPPSPGYDPEFQFEPSTSIGPAGIQQGGFSHGCMVKQGMILLV